MKKTLLAVAISSLALSSAVTVQAQSFDELVNASSVDVNFRYRVESADQDNALDNALANTLKSRITLKTGSVAGFSAVIEGDNVLHVTEDFNSTENGEAAYSVVKDPETTQINQAYVQYKNDSNTVTLGNQRINLDNQRHVGGVAFRQDEQTFDAISLVNTSIDNTTIIAGFANNVNTITNANAELDVTILNVKYAVSPELAATTFYYGAELPNGDAINTLGLRATGKVSDISYEAEVASQSQDASFLSGATTATSADVLYYNLSASTKLADVTAKVGLEVFGSDGAKSAFQTPLGTNHKFFGWSDAYLGGAGANGIQDLNISAVTKVSGVKLVAQLHKFDAVEGSADLGTEIGLLAAKKFGTYGASVKVAQLSGSDSKPDTTKLWLTGTAKF